MRARVLVWVGAVTPVAAFALLAGPLDPPGGAISSTHKTLTQVEPRTPIDPSQVPVVISERGSYYLTDDLRPVTLGEPVIRVQADDVTLDLNGFSVIGASEVGLATVGIELAQGATNLAVRNGAIRECQGHGVAAELGGEGVVTLERLHLVNNAGAGAFFSNHHVRIIDCVSRSNDEGGILCFVGLVHGCSVNVNGTQGEAGISCIAGLIQSNIALGNDGDAIGVLDATVVDNHTD